MKRLKNIIAVVIVMILACNTMSYAQQTDGELKKGVDKVTQEKDKIEKQKRTQEERLEKIKKDKAAKAEAVKDNADYTDKSDQVNKEISKGKETVKQEIEDQKVKLSEEERQKIKDSYSEKLKLQETEEQRAAIKDEMNRAIKNAEKNGVPTKTDVDAKVDKVKKAAAEEVKSKTKKSAESTVDNIQANEKVAVVKAKINKQKAALSSKGQMVAAAKDRIQAASDRLNADIEAGKLTEEQIKAKKEILVRAQAKVDALEGSISKGKAIYSKQDATLQSLQEQN